MPNTAGPYRRDTPTRARRRRVPRILRVWRSRWSDGRLRVRFGGVASQPMAPPGLVSGRSYLTCAPSPGENRRCARPRSLDELLDARIPERPRNVTSCVMRTARAAQPLRATGLRPILRTPSRASSSPRIGGRSCCRDRADRRRRPRGAWAQRIAAAHESPIAAAPCRASRTRARYRATTARDSRPRPKRSVPSRPPEAGPETTPAFRLASTCCSASAKPPTRAGRGQTGRWAACVPLRRRARVIEGGGPKKRRPEASRLSRGSRTGRAACPARQSQPAMASVEDGKMSNWSAGTSGTVWIGMLCAGPPGDGQQTRRERPTRLVMRHLARRDSLIQKYPAYRAAASNQWLRVARVWRARDSVFSRRRTSGSLRRIHPQQPVDRANCPVSARSGTHRPRRRFPPTAPVALVHHRQPGVEHRQDQERESEHPSV